jgi:hypothetical protein
VRCTTEMETLDERLFGDGQLGQAPADPSVDVLRAHAVGDAADDDNTQRYVTMGRSCLQCWPHRRSSCVVAVGCAWDDCAFTWAAPARTALACDARLCASRAVTTAAL